MISLSSRSLLLTLFVSIPSQADISISGSAKVNVTNAESISTSSVSISGATVVTTNTTSIDNTTTVNFNSSTDAQNLDNNMDRDFVLIPLLLSSLFPGDSYVDIATLKTSSNTEVISIPQCCTTYVQPLYSTLPSTTSDDSWSVAFNKSIGNTPYYITGDYQSTNSSRPSILPSYEDLIIGNLAGVNRVDRDIIKTKTGNLGVGVTHSISPTSTVYASTAYSKLHSSYTVVHTRPQYAVDMGLSYLYNFQLPVFKHEGRKDIFGVKFKPVNNLTVDISKEIFHLNNVDLPSFESIKLIHKIDNRISIGFNHKSSEYTDKYYKNTHTEKSVFLRIGF